MAVIHRLINYIESFCKWFLTLGFGVMTAITLLEVFRRYIFGLSFPWAEELVRFLLIWTTFIGGSITFRKGELVYLDLLQKKLSKKNNDVLAIVNTVMILVFLIIILVLSTKYTFSKSIMLQKSTGLNMPMFIPYLSIPVGFLFMSIFAVYNLFIHFGKMKRGDIA